MQVSGLHHLNIRTTPEKVEETREFYEYYMDLKVGPRPDFPFGGYWMDVGDHPPVHISIRDPKGRSPQADGDYGFGHIAFDCQGLDTLKEKLASKGVEYEERPTPDVRDARGCGSPTRLRRRSRSRARAQERAC